MLQYEQNQNYLEKCKFKNNEIPFYIHQRTNISPSNNAMLGKGMGNWEMIQKSLHDIKMWNLMPGYVLIQKQKQQQLTDS